MELLLYVQGDSNDADYVASLTRVTPEDIELLKPIIEKINAFQSYEGMAEDGSKHRHDSNWPVGEYGHRPDLGEKDPQTIYGLTGEQYEWFMDFVPTGEDGNLHTITKIQLLKVEELTVLLGKR